MNELNMSIYTGSEGGNKVTLTATFATHDEAVAFHNGLSALCRQSSTKQVPTLMMDKKTWAQHFLGKPA